MPDETTNIPVTFAPPVLGVFEATRYSEQPERTTPSAQNARGIEPGTRRLRLSQRGGISRYCSAQISGGTTAVQLLASVTKHDGRLSYALDTSPDAKWRVVLPSRMDGIALQVYQGNAYVAAATSAGSTGINYLAKYNAAGTLVWSVPIALAETSHLIKSVKIDPDTGGIYVCIAGSATNAGGAIYKFSETADGYSVFQEWVINALNPLGLWVDCAPRDGVLYAIENTATATRLHRFDDINTANPRWVWDYNAAGVPLSSGARSTSATAAATCVAACQDGSAIIGIPLAYGAATAGALLKIGPNGSKIWDTDSLTDRGGLGYAVVLRDDISGAVFTQGDDRYSSAGTYNVRKLTDSGAAVAHAAGRATDRTTFQGATSLAVDKNGSVYQAVQGGATPVLYRVASDFASDEWTIASSGDMAGVFGVALDDDLVDQGTKVEHVWVGTDATAGTPYYGLQRFSQYTVTSADGSPRSAVYLGVSNTNLYSFTTGASTLVSAAAFQSTTRFLAAASGYNRVLFTDGLNYKSYDAIAGTLSTWAATSAGEIPRRGRLLCMWNGRAVLAGFEDQPQQWAMSRNGDVDDWDFFPPVKDGREAVLGSASRTGLCPDIANCLIPVSDDLLFVGCDHSIFRLTGDPAAAGTFDRISDSIGMAFGMRSACKDENGAVYFFGSQGRVYRLTMAGIEPISRAIDKRLRDIDLTTSKVLLAWNHQSETLHVFVTPYTPGASTHYAWERETGAWWIDTLPSSAFNPLDVLTIDSDDPADRKLLLASCGGTGGGYVWKWDDSASTDDGNAIASYCFLGPVAPGGPAIESSLKGLKAVLSTGSGTVNFDTYGAESPDFNIIGSSVRSSTWTAGRNNPYWEKTRGQSVWVKVGRYPTPHSGTWALEQLTGLADLLGEVRNR